MKQLLIILISILVFSFPVIGQSSKYESINQCVLQKMTEKKLTGDKKFEIAIEECERILENSEKKGEGIKEVFYLGFRNGKLSFYEDKWEVTTPDGKKYVGGLRGGKNHGQGTLTTHDGRKYVGEWKNGKRYGQGTLTTHDGSKYVGGWKNGLRHGQGTYTFPSGDKYVGEWKNGKENGLGIFTFTNGDNYEGEWKDGNQNGQVRYTYPDGRKYVGEYKDGKRNGQGTYSFPSGDKYVGEWKNWNPWNITGYDKIGNILGYVVNGKQQ